MPYDEFVSFRPPADAGGSPAQVWRLECEPPPDSACAEVRVYLRDGMYIAYNGGPGRGVSDTPLDAVRSLLRGAFVPGVVAIGSPAGERFHPSGYAVIAVECAYDGPYAGPSAVLKFPEDL